MNYELWGFTHKIGRWPRRRKVTDILTVEYDQHGIAQVTREVLTNLLCASGAVRHD